MEHKQFLVDAAILHELGERLIGRPAIALGELIKNAYDADATTCRIEFHGDKLVVSDDGFGMSEQVFLDHWLRIATTHKVDQRVSPKGRPLTGSKGIGRLSVQFLAKEMTIESTSLDDGGKSLYVYVDWSRAVRGKALSTVNVDYESRTDHPPYPGNNRTGMRITLEGLNTSWDSEQLREVGDEVWMLRSPFRRSDRAGKRSAMDFHIEIEAPAIAGAREAFDERLTRVMGAWRARIQGKLEHGRSGGKATIVVEFAKGYPKDSEKSHRFSHALRLPVKSEHGKPLVDSAQFEILIYLLQGPQRGRVKVGELKDYLNTFGNVSVYDAGFRLPYYGGGQETAGHDWLNIALDHARRLNSSELLPKELQSQTKYMQDLPQPGRIFGVVEIDTNHERNIARKFKAEPDEWLQIQPGRDRLHDNPAFVQLRDLVRFSLDFYANRFRMLSFQAFERGRGSEAPSRKFDRALRALEQNKSEIPNRVYRQLSGELSDARKASAGIEAEVERRAALLGPLASAGMVALALNHELSRESARLESVIRRLRGLAKRHAIPELIDLAQEFDATRQRLHALQDIFTPLLTDTEAAGLERFKVRPLARQVAQAMKVLMPGVEIDIDGVPADLYFPVGSTAEWSSIFQNLLANAWNAMLDSDRRSIRIRGGEEKGGRQWVRLSDSGQGLGVPLSKSDSLFEPFERKLNVSRSNKSIAIGGQGLGLTIVRMIARRRGVDVAFVEPEDGFSTTFEMSWRGPRK